MCDFIDNLLSFVIFQFVCVLYRDNGSPRFQRQSVRVEVRTGPNVKNSGIMKRGQNHIQKTAFVRVIEHLRLSCAQPTGNIFTVLPQTNGSGRITVGPEGPGPPETPGGPCETSFLRGFKGAYKRPP